MNIPLPVSKVSSYNLICQRSIRKDSRKGLTRSKLLAAEAEWRTMEEVF
jgi:hypothetical protein